MRFNLLRVTFYGVSLSAAAALSGCMDAGAVLAEESGKFAICTLEQGQGCQVSAPNGTRFEKASVAAADDAIRVLGSVAGVSECEGFASHSKSRSPKHISQATINNVVVMPFGEVLPHEPSIKSACAKPPYNVSLTVAKAP